MLKKCSKIYLFISDLNFFKRLQFGYIWCIIIVVVKIPHFRVKSGDFQQAVETDVEKTCFQQILKERTDSNERSAHGYL